MTYVRKASHKPPGGLFILSPFEGGGGGGGKKGGGGFWGGGGGGGGGGNRDGGLILEGSLFNLEKTMVSVLHKN